MVIICVCRKRQKYSVYTDDREFEVQNGLECLFCTFVLYSDIIARENKYR